MNQKTLNLALLGLKAALIVIGVILSILIVSGEGKGPNDVALHNEGAIMGALYLSLAVVVASVAVMLVAGVIQIASNPKKHVTTLIGIGIFAVLMIIAWSMASDEVLPEWIKEDMAEEEMPTAFDAKLSGWGILSFIILLCGAVGAIIVSEVSKMFK